MKKQIIYGVMSAMLLASCGGANNSNNAQQAESPATEQQAVETQAPANNTIDKDKALAAWNELAKKNYAEGVSPEKWGKITMKDGIVCWILKSGYENTAILTSDYKMVDANFGGPVEINVRNDGYIMENIAQGMFIQTTYIHVGANGVDEIWCANAENEKVSFRKSWEEEGFRQTTEDELYDHLPSDPTFIEDIEMQEW